jgi:hypothetical protein
VRLYARKLAEFVINLALANSRRPSLHIQQRSADAEGYTYTTQQVAQTYRSSMLVFTASRFDKTLHAPAQV